MRANSSRFLFISVSGTYVRRNLSIRTSCLENIPTVIAAANFDILIAVTTGTTAGMPALLLLLSQL